MASRNQAQQLLGGPGLEPGAGMPAPASAPQPTPALNPEPGPDVEIMLRAHDGDRSSWWCVSKRVLDERAPFFQPVTDNIDCPGWRIETVESFVNWLKTGEVRVRGMIGDYEDDDSALVWEPGKNHKGTWMFPEPQAAEDLRPWYASFGDNPFAWTLGRILDLYTFAVRANIKAMMTDCILVYQRRICAPHNVVLFAPVLNAVIRHGGHGVDSPLTNFLVDWIVLTTNQASWDAAKIDSLPPSIVAEVMSRTLRRARNGVDTPTGVPDPNVDWCRYHAHGSGQEQVAACMARRPFDADVRAKRRQAAQAEPQYLFTTNRHGMQGALPPSGQNAGQGGVKADEQNPNARGKRRHFFKRRGKNSSAKGKGKEANVKAEEQKPDPKAEEQMPAIKDEKTDLEAEDKEPPKKKRKRTTKK